MVVTSQTWEEIIAYYKEDKNLWQMMEFVKFLSNSEYKFRLFGVVFLDSLVLCAYNTFNLFSHSLHFTFIKGEEKFNCIWYGKEVIEWETQIEKEEIINQFGNLLKKATWY